MTEKIKDESGQAMISTVLAMTCLLGFAGLATDVGMLFHEKRLVQTAADAAAVAGASAIGISNVTSAGDSGASSNGFTNGVNNATVAIYPPPIDGPNTGKAGYVEAIVTKQHSTVFMKIFGFGSVTISGRAVAYSGGASQGCIYVLSPSASPAMLLQGSFDVSAPTCGVEVNSNSSDALQFTGAGGTLTAGSIGVVGGDGGQTGDSTPAPATGIAPFSDPIPYTAPVVTSSSSTTGTGKKAVTTYTFSVTDSAGNTASCPAGGTLTGTLTATGPLMCYSGNVILNNVTLGNATYVFTGNSSSGNSVTFSGTVSTGTGGSTIDIDSGALTIATGTTMNLTAPTDGGTLAGGEIAPYGGIVLMQPLANTNTIEIQKGNAFGSLTGIIWAPGAELFLNDSGGDTSGGITLTTDLVVNTLVDKTSTLTMQSYSQTIGKSPLTKVTLVE